MSCRLRLCRAMTLIELLVAVSLGMVIIAMAWTAFVRANSSAARAMVRVDLHATAAVVREYLSRDLANAAPALAFFARSIPQVAGVDAGGAPIRTDTVEMVFMCQASRLEDEMSTGEEQTRKSEFSWVRWRFRRTWKEVAGAWTPVSGALYRSISSPARNWVPKNTLVPPVPVPETYPPNAANTPTYLLTPPIAKWTNYGGRTYMNLPRPLRDASQGIESLDNNRYGTPVAHTTEDIGDLADLDSPDNDRLVSNRIRDFAIGWQDALGGAEVVASSAAADHRIDGLYLDVTGPAGNDHAKQLGARPRVTRVAFNLADAKTGVSQDFSFSIALPGIQTQMGR
ncbi:MAG: prepilin-type N-terminal cleavage/methylation domain-containing protein [Planctomycetes bacterium]|nr:prepilin-type N-terminal cleavage/methylation domain-containing protein [Planctomycetota bacterium]